MSELNKQITPRFFPRWITPLGMLRTLFELCLIGLVIHFAARSASLGVFWTKSIVHQVPTREKLAALTFDDGPNLEFTPELLRVLAKYKVKATFFMIGREMLKYPQIVREVLAQGHTIANHTYSHPHDIEAETKPKIIDELDRCERVIEKMTGKRAHLFRPPRGLVDGTVVLIAQEEGYRTILWTVSADHHDAPTPQAMADRVVRLMRPGGIILAHDGAFASRWKDVASAPLIIKALRRRGYRFVTVPELLKYAGS